MEIRKHFIMASRYQSTGFFVRGTGHFAIRQKEPVKQADYGEIFWCVSGSGSVLYQEKKYLLRPEFIFYFPPGSIHDFTPSEQGCEYFWMSVEGCYDGVLFEALGITPGLQECGKCPEELFVLLEEYLKNSIRESQLKALTVAFEILTTAVSPRPCRQSEMEQIKDYMDQHFHLADLNVNSLAQQFHLHRVLLSRMFRTRYGIAPGEYLISLRVQKAISLLTSTGLPVKEISGMCGFSNADYFTKVIRRVTGQSPLAVRGRHGA